MDPDRTAIGSVPLDDFVLTTPETYAVLIGSHAYRSALNADTTIRGDLDVQNMADVLGQRCVPTANITKLVYNYLGFSPSADTVDNDIHEAIAAIADIAKPGDKLIFFYSGHSSSGKSELLGEPAFNAVSGGSYQDDRLVTELANPKLANVDKLVVLDTCYAGGFWPDKPGLTEQDLSGLNHVALLGACMWDQTTTPTPDFTGALTNAILPGLLDPNTTFNSLYALAKATVHQTVGYFKDDGFGIGDNNPVGYYSADFDPNWRNY